jgi:hypothetical protein
MDTLPFNGKFLWFIIVSALSALPLFGTVAGLAPPGCGFGNVSAAAVFGRS